MGKESRIRKLDVDMLDRVILASDERQWAESAIRMLQAVSDGDFYSLVRFNLHTLATEVFFPESGWLPPGHLVLEAVQQRLAEHPCTENFLTDRRSAVRVRSQLVCESIWKRSAIYNEVDRPLGIKDLVGIYQTTETNHVVVLSCGRSGLFSDRDIAPFQSCQRVLSALTQARLKETQANVRLACGTLSVPRNSRLTPREREILHWLRQGKSNTEIATILSLSHHTVRHHLENIYPKLGVESRLAAALSQTC